MAATGVGKTAFMCDYAAFLTSAGYNVLYITLEMAEERIAERIDCNLLDMSSLDLSKLDRRRYVDSVEEIKKKSRGRLIIKEYPTVGAHSGHFQSLIDELRMKQNFVPDVVFIDYVNICSSQRISSYGNSNSYFWVKSIAEELRGLAVRNNVVLFSATQTNRGGFNNTDPDMTDTSESAGLPMTLDFMFVVMRTEELDEQGQVLVKQLKSRYNDINYYRKFIIGVELAKFKFFDIDNSSVFLSGRGNSGQSGSASLPSPGFIKEKTNNLDTSTIIF
jgi:replicative DNA helicase